jgi:hypothetical protein
MASRKKPESKARQPKIEVADLEIGSQEQNGSSVAAKASPKGGEGRNTVVTYNFTQAWPKK